MFPECLVVGLRTGIARSEKSFQIYTSGICYVMCQDWLSVIMNEVDNLGSFDADEM